MLLIFWTKFAKKGYFWSKTEKVNITMNSAYLKSLGTNYQGELIILRTKVAQKVY